MNEKPILYVVLNKELKMSAGKAAAQAVHAAMSLGVGTRFGNSPKRTVIILEAETGEQLKNLKEYLDKNRLRSEYYIDEGVNEVAPYSITALAVEPFNDDNEEKREIFAGFSLFSVYEDEGEDRKTNDYQEALDYLYMINHYTEKSPWYLK